MEVLSLKAFKLTGRPLSEFSYRHFALREFTRLEDEQDILAAVERHTHLSIQADLIKRKKHGTDHQQRKNNTEYTTR